MLIELYMILVVNLLRQLSGNKMKKFLSFLAILCSTFVFSQENKELEVHKIGGKQYYIHVVDSGNTLYAISRKYAVPVDVIQKENPRLTNELTIGDRLLIPLKEVIRKDLDETLEIDGNFLIHEVQKRSTLYSIAKEYNVEQKDIIAANPDLKEGLKNGMKIKIPVAKVKSTAEEAEYIKPAASNPYVTHLVLPKQTLYGLSKEYGVTVDSILQVNNGLPEGLSSGQLINIPILKSYKDTSQKIVFDSNAVKKSYSISLLLPLYQNEYDFEPDTSVSYDEKLENLNRLFNKSQYGIDFYQGFKLALDSLTEQSFQINLNVFDTNGDTLVIDSLINSGLLDSSDLIVGPLYYSEFRRMADFAKMNKINIVSPVKQSNKILLGNPKVSKVASSEAVQIKYLSNYMADSLRYENLIIVYPDNFKDRSRVESIKKQFNASVLASKDSMPVSFPKEFIWDASKFYSLKSQFVEARTNTLIIPSDDQAFVTRFMTMLYPLRQEYKLNVIALESILKFDNLELEYLDSLNVQLIATDFIDYHSNDFKHFDSQYFKEYGSLADKFSVLGFDVGMYYTQILKDYGKNFELMFLGFQYKGLGRKFEFFKTGIESGYENQSIYLLEFSNYKWNILH